MVDKSKVQAAKRRVAVFEEISRIRDPILALLLMTYEVWLVAGIIGLSSKEVEDWNSLMEPKGYPLLSQYGEYISRVVHSGVGSVGVLFRERSEYPWDTPRIASWFIQVARDQNLPPDRKYVHSRQGRKRGRVHRDHPIPAWYLGEGKSLRGSGISEISESFLLEDGRVVEREKERWVNQNVLVNPCAQWEKCPKEIELGPRYLIRIADMLNLCEKYKSFF